MIGNEKFQCDCCGLCCRNVRRSLLQVTFDRGDGICKFLDTESNLCKIYDNRPIVCNVESYYEKFLADKFSRKDFYELNYKVCKSLKEGVEV